MLCIIDPDDKPFGADLPIEVQNRILWMSWHAEYQERLINVHKELKEMQTCHLTDWLRVPKPYERFHSPLKMVCNCSECDPKPVCHWCVLYGNKHASVEFTVMETKLQHIRDSFSTYDEDRYEQFVSTYLPKFRDVLQYTVSVVILPMLVWMPTGRYQFNSKRGLSPLASFASVSLAHVMFIEGCMETACVTQFRNPREVRRRHEALARAVYESKKKKEDSQH